MLSTTLGGAAVGQFVQPAVLEADYRQLEARLSPFRGSAASSSGETRCEPRRTYHSLLELAIAQPLFLVLDPLLDPDSSSATTCFGSSISSRTEAEGDTASAERGKWERPQQRQQQQQDKRQDQHQQKSTCATPEQQTRFVSAFLASPPITRRSPPPLVPDTEPRTRYGLHVRTSTSPNAEALYRDYVRAQELAGATHCSLRLREESHKPLVTGPGAIASSECALNLRPPSLTAPSSTNRADLHNGNAEEMLFLPMPLAHINIARENASKRIIGQTEPSALRSQVLSFALHTPRITASSNKFYAKYAMPPLVDANASSSGSSPIIKNAWFFDIRPSNSAIQLYKSYACSLQVPLR